MHDIVLNWDPATVDRSHAILSPFWSKISDLLEAGHSPDELRPRVLHALQKVATAPDAFDSAEAFKIVRDQVNCAEDNSSARSLVLQHPVATALMIFRAARLSGFTGARLNDLLVGPRKGTPGYTAASRFIAGCFAAFKKQIIYEH